MGNTWDNLTATIPYVDSKNLSIICFILNIILPGTGTILAY